jgi:glycosyltransferase involved in cell wall biosynthesis
MKILHVTPAYMPAYRYGGPIQSVHALNKWLVRAHAEVTVYTTPINGPKDSDVPISTARDLRPVDRNGVQVHYFKPSWPRSWFNSREMRNALKEHAKDFDIIHITSVFLSVSTLAARAAKDVGVPYIISPRGSLMTAPLEKKSPLKKSLYMGFIERENLENADALHFTTEPERAEYEKLGYRMKKAIVIPNGLDPESLSSGDPETFRSEFNIPQGKRIVLFLGRLSWKKGLDTLIPAFAKVVEKIPEAVLVLAGGDDENYKPTLEKLIESANLRSKVIFTGPILGSERTAAYRNAEIFVLPSYSENFAGTVAEAMYFGVPVVVSEGVGLSSVVRESGAGLAVPKDTAAFVSAMIEILKDPVRAKEMGERGISTVANKFSYDKVAQAFLGAYNEVIASHKKHG